MSIATLIILLGIANLVASRFSLRSDVTEGNIYTLSQGTRSILERLDDIVTIRLYFSPNLPPALLALRRSVDDLLEELKQVAGEKLQVEYRDPAASPSEEHVVAMMGIPPVELNVIENDRSEVTKIYLGMAILHGTQQEILPVVQRADHLEYQLAEAILRVSGEKLPTIGWWGGDSFGRAREATEKRYRIVDMDAKHLDQLDIKEIPLLVLMAPRDLDDHALKVFEDYLTSGGRLIACVDRYILLDGLRVEEQTSPLFDFLVKHGVTVDASLVLDVANATAAFSGGIVTYHLPYPYWPQVAAGGFAADLPMAAGLQSLVLPWTSPLTLAVSSDERTVQSVARTTSFGVAVAGEALSRLDPKSSVELLQQGEKGERTLTALVTEKKSSSAIFVVGTSRFLEDTFLQMFPANAIFFENAIDQLGHGEKLIGIRSRLALDRPLQPLSDAERNGLKYANFAFAPVLLLVTGGMVFFFRRRSQHKAYRLYAKGITP